MKTQITLEGKEVRQIIAHALMIPEERVIPLRYNFAIEGVPADELMQRLITAGVDTEGK